MWSVSINRNLSFDELMQLQEAALARLQPFGGSELLFAELKPTITLGSRQVHEYAQFDHLNEVRAIAASKGIDVVHGHRGGNETWHGPGQWVGFVVTPLEKFTGDPRGVRKAVCGILNTVLKVVHHYVPEAVVETDDRMGIWSSREPGSKKIVSVGIKIRNGYITSGFALNCFPTETSFFSIEPCGIRGASAGFIFESRISSEQLESEFVKIPLKLKEAFESLVPAACGGT